MTMKEMNTIRYTMETVHQAAAAMEALPLLKGTEAHCTVILSRVDENVLSKLGINLSCDPTYESHKLYHA